MRCRFVVERTDAAMRCLGGPPKHTFDAALVVYRCHHPDEPKELADLTMMRWTHHASVH